MPYSLSSCSSAVSYTHLDVYKRQRPDGTLLGYGGLLAVGREGDIQTIALDPATRGAGQGRRLMNALLDAAAAQGVHEVFLEVRADNPVARGLYESLGFEEIGVRPKYYQPDGVDAVVMRLQMTARVTVNSEDRDKADRAALALSLIHI